MFFHAVAPLIAPPNRRIANRIRVRFAAALFPLYRPVKVVPAHPGRSRSTALDPPVTSDGASRVRDGSRAARTKVESYQPTTNFNDLHRTV